MSEDIKPDIKPDDKNPQPHTTEPVKVIPSTPETAKVAPGRYGTGGGGDSPQIGLGTTLTITPPATMSLSPSVVVKVMSIKPPQWTSKDVDVTGMNDVFETYIPGVPNTGEGEIDMLYMHTQQNSLYSLVNQAGTGFAVGLPGGGSRTWAGFINSFGEEIPVKDKIQCKVKCRATSTVTFA